MEEICLCHGEVWRDRIDLLEHQVQFYMRRTEKNRKEERRLKIYEQKLDEEKRNFMQERAMAMAAWEQQLDQRSRELAIRARQFTPES